MKGIILFIIVSFVQVVSTVYFFWDWQNNSELQVIGFLCMIPSGVIMQVVSWQKRKEDIKWNEKVF